MINKGGGKGKQQRRTKRAQKSLIRKHSNKQFQDHQMMKKTLKCQSSVYDYLIITM